MKHGDLGDMANELLAGHFPSDGGTGALTLRDVAKAMENLASLRGNGAKLVTAEELLRRAQPVEAKYIVKIVTGDLRIGLREGLVEEAIAQAYGRAAEDVRRANMLGGDIAATLRLAAAGELQGAKLRLLHPIGFMLASPVDTPEEALEYFPEGALVEDKLDGIRAQVHKSAGKVKLFSRTLDEIVRISGVVWRALRSYRENSFSMEKWWDGKDWTAVAVHRVAEAVGAETSGYVADAGHPRAVRGV